MNLAELLRQKAEVERAILSAQAETRAKALGDIRSLMAEHGLSVHDLAALPTKGRKAGPVRSSKPVAAKYRDELGNSWTGRGLKPKWLTAALADGKSIDEFAV